MKFAEILKQLAAFERMLNEIKYPPETAFQPSFSRRILKAEQESMKYDFPAFEIEDLLKKVEQ
ncbi:hypothetical protein FTO70_12235 [Methanosarcina sp. KYL-1]|uniref:hypothetical protein n=1 Tax=Methanosarcina sp. KYL-1 TaxID=2602068 RepID=UPI0021014BE7|nr:hypothetical protein [Methanosarcina sp. KYL-1]MCQ1536428.1 hypothetical protein [Methanosarcina sp. KYL-1]